MCYRIITIDVRDVNRYVKSDNNRSLKTKSTLYAKIVNLKEEPIAQAINLELDNDM